MVVHTPLTLSYVKRGNTTVKEKSAQLRFMKQKKNRLSHFANEGNSISFLHHLTKSMTNFLCSSSERMTLVDVVFGTIVPSAIAPNTTGIVPNAFEIVPKNCLRLYGVTLSDVKEGNIV